MVSQGSRQRSVGAKSADTFKSSQIAREIYLEPLVLSSLVIWGIFELCEKSEPPLIACWRDICDGKPGI